MQISGSVLMQGDNVGDGGLTGDLINGCNLIKKGMKSANSSSINDHHWNNGELGQKEALWQGLTHQTGARSTKREKRLQVFIFGFMNVSGKG